MIKLENKRKVVTPLEKCLSSPHTHWGFKFQSQEVKLVICGHLPLTTPQMPREGERGAGVTSQDGHQMKPAGCTELSGLMTNRTKRIPALSCNLWKLGRWAEAEGRWGYCGSKWSKWGGTKRSGESLPLLVDELLTKELLLTTFSTGLMAAVLPCHCCLFNLPI